MLASAQTFLFVPANRPDRFDKAARAGADVVILDLEDAVPEEEKTAAREHARQWLRHAGPAMVRINGSDTPWHCEDVDMVTSCRTAVMLPKAEDGGPIEKMAARYPDIDVIALVETARGVDQAVALATDPHVHRLAFGSIDLGAQLGVDPDDREALLYARSRVALASSIGRLAPPIDGVTTNITDLERVGDDTAYARRIGMGAKLCIHPAQLRPVRQALAPTPDELDWARSVLAAAARDGGATAVNGAMIDHPVVLRAQHIISLTAR
ncbi:HpcH/HpaI aldolase/citrate lyase family protein [Mycobacterium sp. NPDC003323]